MNPPDRMRDIDETHELATQALGVAEADDRRKMSNPEVRRRMAVTGLVAAIVAFVASTVVNWAIVDDVAEVKTNQRLNAAEAEQSRELAQRAYEEAQQANGTLQQRGQQPVPVPGPDAQDPSATLASAAAAKVLASLPDLRPSDADLGAAVARYIIANPQGPSAATLANLIAGYFRENPPPSGPPGPTGAPGKDGQRGAPGQDGADGPPPSADSILAAVQTYCSTRNECRGETGAQGVSIQSMGPFTTDPDSSTGCSLVVTLVNPANGNTLTESVAVPLAFCTGVPS